MLQPEHLLLIPALIFFAYWLYRLLASYVSRGGNTRIDLRGLLWLVVLIGLIALSVLMMKGQS